MEYLLLQIQQHQTQINNSIVPSCCNNNGATSLPRFGGLLVSVFVVEVVEKFKNYSVSVTSNVEDGVTVMFRSNPTRFFRRRTVISPDGFD
jgi:hypothetical protein